MSVHSDTKHANETFNYFVMYATEDIEHELSLIEYDSMPIEKLDVNGWKLIDKQTRKNISKIEGQMIPIKILYERA